jgi:hypothetical protein
MTELDRVIDELYALPLAEFTAQRNASAKGSAHGAAIRALPKPSAAASVVNLFVRSRPEDFASLVDLGERMRAAAPSELRDLNTARRKLVGEAVEAAASENGQPVSGSVRQEVADTLQSVVRDADAAAAVATGRLLRSLEAEGLGDLDLADAIAGEPGSPRQAPNATTAGDKGDKREQRRRATALAAAKKKAEDADKEARAAAQARDGLAEDVSAAADRLEDARELVARTEADAKRLAAELASAQKEARDADKRKERAQRELEALG